MNSSDHSRRGSNNGGFTLVEVVLCLVILVLLAGSVFKTVQATLTVTSTLKTVNQNRQQIMGFFELCRKTFLTINQGATMVWNSTTSGAVTLAELDLRQAPTAFTWGTQDTYYGETSLCTHPASDGTLTLGIELRQIDPLTGNIEPNPLWLPLVANLQTVTWNFYDNRTSQWQPTWTDSTRHPSIINISLQYYGDSQVWTQSFYLPVLSAPPAANIAGNSNNNSNNSTQQNNPSLNGPNPGSPNSNGNGVQNGYGSNNGSLGPPPGGLNNNNPNSNYFRRQ